MSGNISPSRLLPLTSPSNDVSSPCYSPPKLISPKSQVSSPDIVEYITPSIHKQEGVAPFKPLDPMPYVPPQVRRRLAPAPLKPSDLMPIAASRIYQQEGVAPVATLRYFSKRRIPDLIGSRWVPIKRPKYVCDASSRTEESSAK
ncbi:hypothetical protein DAI22_06g144900 [Oryza sativa Japonica Group]|nr:uncharacterized protein LOC107281387 [Oryza sativa Japonica Group]KAF2926659.1 hypothetical protein DAI22_06g144900 [Oryza sativa Japonica Group]